MQAPEDPAPLTDEDRRLIDRMLDDAGTAATTVEVGAIGEAVAQVWLVANGWMLFHQDSGERGIDAAYYHPELNRLMLVEVKTTRTGRSGFRTSRWRGQRQAGPSWTMDRLERVGYPGLETAAEMVAFLGVKIDVAARTIRFYRPETERADRWVPVGAPLGL